MNDVKKARTILKALDKYIQVNWNAEEYYLAGVMKGLKEIEKREKKGA